MDGFEEILLLLNHYTILNGLFTVSVDDESVTWPASLAEVAGRKAFNQGRNPKR